MIESQLVAASEHLLGAIGGDEAGRLMFAGAPSRGTHVLHFFAHLPYSEMTIRKNCCT